jgi:hypothetical protein
MQQQINVNHIISMIYKAKTVFLESNAPKHLKRLFEKMNPFIVINDDTRAMGTAYIVHRGNREAETHNIPNFREPSRFQGRTVWHVIEISKELHNTNNLEEVYDTVSHELAHLLEYHVNGYYNRTMKTFHNKDWKYIHLCMGGNGQTKAL